MENTGKQVTFAEVVKGTVNRDAELFMLDWYKIYLGSCATYHYAFMRSLLHGVRDVKTVLQGNCNAGVSISKEKGYYGMWNFWLNERGIANLLSIPQLEKDGYVIDYNSKRYWAVTTPEGKVLLFKKDTGTCAGMPYLDICKNHDALEMIQTVCDNFGMFTERQVEKAIAARDMQVRLAHPTD